MKGSASHSTKHLILVISANSVAHLGTVNNTYSDSVRVLWQTATFPTYTPAGVASEAHTETRFARNDRLKES